MNMDKSTRCTICGIHSMHYEWFTSTRKDKTDPVIFCEECFKDFAHFANPNHFEKELCLFLLAFGLGMALASIFKMGCLI